MTRGTPLWRRIIVGIFGAAIFVLAALGGRESTLEGEGPRWAVFLAGICASVLAGLCIAFAIFDPPDEVIYGPDDDE